MDTAANVVAFARNWLRDLAYPGLDLHTRNRAALCKFWNTGPRDVFDAGSGNGYFSWLAYKSGAHVIGISFNSEQVKKASKFLVKFKNADPRRLWFERRNLYELSEENRRFDEILCYEVLEHVRRDLDVIAQFYRLLRPGGVLHLCCPYRLHPRHQAEVLDVSESGGHVRAGYTFQDYRALLEPAGFIISRCVGIGPPAVYYADRILRAIRNRVGDWLALPLLPFFLPVVWLARFDPKTPFSLYVTAIKQTDAK
jgi:SAM-dependent methyltransferase